MQHNWIENGIISNLDRNLLVQTKWSQPNPDVEDTPEYVDHRGDILGSIHYLLFDGLYIGLRNVED